MITNIDDISSANPHWHSKVFSVCEYPYKRKTYSSLHAWLNERQMISLSGLRRTGKSVLLEQMQDEYVKKHLKGDTKRLFRFSFDVEDILERIPTKELSDILSYYSQY